MTTATELVIEEQLGQLREIATDREWQLEILDSVRFTIGLVARDGSDYYLLVDCDGFPSQPPAFHWYDPKSGALDVPAATPKGSDYLHSSGRICAPWNRLAYTQVDPKGPHGDWQFANWMTNRHTRETRTLAAMVLRIHRELRSSNYHGRMA
jgi:hypothetical protein